MEVGRRQLQKLCGLGGCDAYYVEAKHAAAIPTAAAAVPAPATATVADEPEPFPTPTSLGARLDRAPKRFGDGMDGRPAGGHGTRGEYREGIKIAT